MTAQRALEATSDTGDPGGGEGARPELERVLLRKDGTAWTIDRVERKDFCFHVRARRRGDGPAPGDPGEESPEGAGVEVLEDAPVEQGERIEWRRPDGSVAWSMTCPLGPVEWGDDPEAAAS